MLTLKEEKDLDVIQKKLVEYKVFFEKNNLIEDSLYSRILEQIAFLEQINTRLLLSSPPSPCDKIRAKYISDPKVKNDPKQTLIIDKGSLLRPSRKAGRDPILAQKELLKRLECLNKDTRLSKKNLTLSISSGILIVNSANNRYRFDGDVIIDTLGIIPTCLDDGLDIPGGEYITQEYLQKLIGDYKVQKLTYFKKRQALESKMDLLRANISSLLITKEDLNELQALSELYQGEKKDRRKKSISNSINILHDLRNKHYKAHKDDAVYQALTFNGTEEIQIAADWAEDGSYAILEKEVLEALKKSIVRKEASGEPEILTEHQDEVETEEYAVTAVELPYSVRGEGDENPIDLNDIDQGALGDCYYLASIGAVAKGHPEFFTAGTEKSIVKEKEDKYVVTLHLRTDRDSLERTPVEVEISKKSLTNKDGTPIYAGKADGELWVILLERALAQEMGNFDNIEGGRTEHAMEMLTGKKPKKIQFGSLTGSTEDRAKNLLERLEVAQEQNYPVTFSSNGKDETPKDIVDADGNTVAVLGGHAYTFEKLEGNIVCLYNPHGKGHLRLELTTLLNEFGSASVLALKKEK
jgi:hypothetical protein